MRLKALLSHAAINTNSNSHKSRDVHLVVAGLFYNKNNDGKLIWVIKYEI